MEDYLKASQLAEEELKTAKVEKIKGIVKETLEKLEVFEKQKKDLEEKIKVLRMDIDDLKVGALDKIEERQNLNPRAKEISVFTVSDGETLPKGTVTIRTAFGDFNATTTDFRWHTTGTYLLGSGIIKYIRF